MFVLYIVTAVALGASLIASRQKTVAAFKQAARRLLKIMPTFLLVIALFAVSITLLSRETILHWLGKDSGPLGLVIAVGVGSITLMPGFIAFPLSGALLAQGVLRMVLAGFTTTLMMVGVLTWPLERRYFGRSVALIRNGVSLLIALIVALVMGLVFGEVGQ